MTVGRSLYVTGGRQRTGALHMEEWKQYGEAAVARVDSEDRVSIVCTYATPADARPVEPSSILFKSASLKNDRLHVCTQTEVLTLAVPSMEILARISLPCFNDVHHVLPTAGGDLLVVNTGLDMVVRIDARGAVTEEWSVLGAGPWDGFERDVDYRRVLTTKPHKAHPNFVFQLGEEVWATRFEQRDAVSLSRPGRRIDLSVGRPHDGIVVDDHVCFSTVNGYLVVVDARSLKTIETIDLNESNDSGRSLGWCRGLLVDDDGFWVGFSRLRPTRWKANISWARHGFNRVGQYNSLPTRIVRYDRSGRIVESTVNLEESGLNAVFSVVRWAGSGP